MIDVVIPTIGRPSLRALLDSLARCSGARPARVILVDDRRERGAALDLAGLDPDLAARISVLAGRSAGPASARNIGWRASRADLIAFVHDDVLLGPSWLEDLRRDLRDLPPDVAGSQARVEVPLPAQRRPTDWERNVAGLASSQWITADCAYRRADLLAVGGFDERFPRAYARTPTWRCASSRAVSASCGASAAPATRCARRTGRSACACRPATPTTC